ncbi:MAG: alpha/beta hydrolase [Clostridia bacterium]|nr:alpha/beta hydrolase [Clostridia bacterium]
MRKNGCVNLGDTGMYYAAFGSGPRNLVVLPGLSDGLATVKGKAWILSSSFRKFFREYTVYVFSRKNDMPQGYSIRDMAEDQVRAMREIGIRKACLLGVSQGGMIAQMIAVSYPEMVEKLVLAVTAPSANAVVRENVSAWIGMAEKGDHTALMADTAEKMYSETYLQKNRKWFPLLARFTKPRSYDRFLKNAQAILSFDCTGELGKIQCPTLILAGSEDHTVGKDAEGEMNRRIPGSELFVYEGLGHGAYEEAKDFYDRVLEFCSRQGAGTGEGERQANTVKKLEIRDAEQFAEVIGQIGVRNLVSMEVETYTGSYLDGVNWDFLRYVYNRDKEPDRDRWIDYTIVNKESVSPESLASDFTELKEKGLAAWPVILTYEEEGTEDSARGQN